MKQLFFALASILVFSTYSHASLEDRLLSSNTQKQAEAFDKFQKLDDESKENSAQKMVERLIDTDKTIEEYSSYRGIPGEGQISAEAGDTKLRITYALKTMGKAAVKPLMKELANPASNVKYDIIKILGEIGEDAAPAIPQLKTYLGSGEIYSTIATQTLARIGPAAISALLEPNDDSAAKDALISMGSVAIPELIKHLPNLKAIEVLGEIGPAAKDALPTLKNLLADKSLYQATHDAIDKIDPTVFEKEKQGIALQQAKKQKEKQEAHLIWEKYAKKLLVGDKLKIPDNKTLLRMAGYEDDARINIIESTLFLENNLGYPTLDSYYFIFTSKRNHIEKILTILFDRGEDETQAPNLLAYAPMLVYAKTHQPGIDKSNDRAEPSLSYAAYISKEGLSAEMQDEYIVSPHTASYFVFHYSDEYRVNEGAFTGDKTYAEICSLILKGADGARLNVGEGGKFHLTTFKLIYSH